MFIATLTQFVSMSCILHENKNNGDKFYFRNQQIGVLHGHKKQSGRSGLGQSNFMQTKHAHEHFNLKIHVDIKPARMRISQVFDTRLFTALIRNTCTK